MQKTIEKQQFTIAFYNLENLFDIYDDPETDDDDFTPRGYKKWNYKKYKNKVQNLGEAIVSTGIQHVGAPPVVVGVAEVENEQVVMDLVNSKALKEHHYDYVHYDSPDERGIDVAFLYRKEFFEYQSSEIHPIVIIEPNGERDFTRDILQVKGKVLGKETYFFVNHWPSRTEGVEETAYKRMIASNVLMDKVDKISDKEDKPYIVIMGDFNDEPYDRSLLNLLEKNTLFNPFQAQKDKGKGSSHSQNQWYLFDQILFSKNFLSENNHLSFKYTEINNVKMIKTWRGKRRNTPFRTYIGKWHQGGYSDHFPVYAILEV
jgi:hypothetical protein